MFLTVEDVARRLGWTRQVVYRAAATGRLPARRWRGRIVFLENDLRTFFRQLPPLEVTYAPNGRKLATLAKEAR
jgi:excisionase family DNA binding protein